MKNEMRVCSGNTADKKPNLYEPIQIPFQAQYME